LVADGVGNASACFRPSFLTIHAVLLLENVISELVRENIERIFFCHDVPLFDWNPRLMR
jgi:hypothetical protein